MLNAFRKLSSRRAFKGALCEIADSSEDILNSADKKHGLATKFDG